MNVERIRCIVSCESTSPCIALTYMEAVVLLCILSAANGLTRTQQKSSFGPCFRAPPPQPQFISWLKSGVILPGPPSMARAAAAAVTLLNYTFGQSLIASFVNSIFLPFLEDDDFWPDVTLVLSLSGSQELHMSQPPPSSSSGTGFSSAMGSTFSKFNSLDRRALMSR